MSAKRRQMDVGWSTEQLARFARHPLASVRRAGDRYERARESYHARSAEGIATKRDRARVYRAEEVLIDALVAARRHPKVAR